MTTNMNRLLFTGVVCSALFLSPSLWGAEGSAASAVHPSSNQKAAAAKAKTKRDWYPFGGYVAAVNPQAKTVSLRRKVGERVLRLDAASQIEVDGKPAALDRVRAGDYAHGKLHKDAAGQEVITAAKFDKTGPKKEAKAPTSQTQR
jgi:hypothetical protein